MSYSASKAGRTKAVTVRIPVQRLERVMRLRKATTQSELVNDLLAEEEERLRSAAAVRETAGVARRGEIDDRLL